MKIDLGNKLDTWTVMKRSSMWVWFAIDSMRFGVPVLNDMRMMRDSIHATSRSINNAITRVDSS